MANEEFFKGLDNLQVNIEQESERLVHKLALEIFSVVTLATPVGDPTKWQNPESKAAGYIGGRARGNWQVSAGNPVGGETDMTDPSGQATIKDGTKEILEIQLGTDIVIQNNVPYIRVLNEGRPDGTKHSEQAPIGFVEISVATAQEAFESESFNL